MKREALYERWRTETGDGLRTRVIASIRAGESLIPVLNEFVGASEVQGEEDLRGIDLQRVDLKGADLSFARLDYAHLDECNLTEAQLQHASLVGASLTRVKARAALLTCVNAAGANFDGADLDGADLSSSNLQRATLRGASLRHADLSRSDFTQADVTGADLDGADLYAARQLEPASPSAVAIEERAWVLGESAREVASPPPAAPRGWQPAREAGDWAEVGVLSPSEPEARRPVGPLALAAVLVGIVAGLMYYRLGPFQQSAATGEFAHHSATLVPVVEVPALVQAPDKPNSITLKGTLTLRGGDIRATAGLLERLQNEAQDGRAVALWLEASPDRRLLASYPTGTGPEEGRLGRASLKLLDFDSESGRVVWSGTFHVEPSIRVSDYAPGDQVIVTLGRDESRPGAVQAKQIRKASAAQDKPD